MASSRDSPGFERCGRPGTVVRAFSIPFQADEVILEFIEEYHRMAKTVLEEILKAEKLTSKERRQ
ncbi:MAG: hypothetical protein J7J27_01335, partial [Euryarchaeota archaeon]|nr:hypothetical protein [Euryarchaeota archaeon]